MEISASGAMISPDVHAPEMEERTQKGNRTVGFSFTVRKENYKAPLSGDILPICALGPKEGASPIPCPQNYKSLTIDKWGAGETG